MNHPELSPEGQCDEINQEGKLSDECPGESLNYTIPLLGMEIPIPHQGCCRPDGLCGLDITAFPLGCPERTSFSNESFEAVSCSY